MPRAKSYSIDELKERALQQFWVHGYDGTSMDELVTATGISRHGLYKEFGGKRSIFLACFDHYQRTIVSPAFARVEQAGSTLADVRSYFEHQIEAAQAIGLPGPGCFVANSTTEAAPHDESVHSCVDHHNDRLKAGFASALRNSAGRALAENEASIAALAQMLLVFATGLWSASRVTEDAGALRASVETFLDILEERLS
ncbi:MAG: TetR/AcrR family transcriptional regulator [Pseudomonadota bacterium]